MYHWIAYVLTKFAMYWELDAKIWKWKSYVILFYIGLDPHIHFTENCIQQSYRVVLKLLSVFPIESPFNIAVG